MGQIINGFELAKKMRVAMKAQVLELKEKYGRVPHLVVVLVGNNPASLSYVTGKTKASEEVGIQSTLLRIDESIDEHQLLKRIDSLNKDPEVDGILVQLPLPKHINEQRIIDAVAYEKDADGFHPLNAGLLSMKRPSTLPCTPKGIIRMLEEINVNLSGMNAVVIGRSNIVGMPISQLLTHRNATVTVCHSRTKDLASVTREADLLVAAIGKPLFVTKDMVKPGAIVIDVEIGRASCRERVSVCV